MSVPTRLPISVPTTVPKILPLERGSAEALPQSAENVDYVGGNAWTFVDQALVEDDWAAIVCLVDEENSDYLVLGDFGLAMPAGRSLDGIEVRINAADLDGRYSEAFFWVWIYGHDSSVSSKKIGDLLPAGMERVTQVFGSPTDTWGLTTAAVGANMAVRIVAQCGVHSYDPGVFWAELKLYYS